MSSPLPAATQAQAFDPEWARRVQKKLGDVGDLSNPEVQRYANRKLRKLRAPAATSSTGTTGTGTTGTGTTGTGTTPAPGGPATTPGSLPSPTGPATTGVPGSNQITGGSYLPQNPLWRTPTVPAAEKQKQALKKLPTDRVIYY